MKKNKEIGQKPESKKKNDNNLVDDKTFTGRRETTIEKYGERLPVGVYSPKEGILHKNFKIKTWKTKDERELGKKLTENTSLVDHVTIIVSNMCSKIGPHDFDEIGDAQKKLIVSTMYMGDIFYLYTLIRIKSMGNELTVKIKCPQKGCDIEFPFTCDLNTIDLGVVESVDDIAWEYKLMDPIDIRGKRVEKFLLAYPKWSFMESQSGNQNSGEIKASTIIDSVIGLNIDLDKEIDESSSVKLALNEIDELSKRDFEMVLKELDEKYLGPKMILEGECSPNVCKRFKGGHKFYKTIDWSYKNFFEYSSR